MASILSLRGIDCKDSVSKDTDCRGDPAELDEMLMVDNLNLNSLVGFSFITFDDVVSYCTTRWVLIGELICYDGENPLAMSVIWISLFRDSWSMLDYFILVKNCLVELN